MGIKKKITQFNYKIFCGEQVEVLGFQEEFLTLCGWDPVKAKPILKAKSGKLLNNCDAIKTIYIGG
jgi:hypothetical protein